MKETLKTAAFGLAALVLAVAAMLVQPDAFTADVLSDQGDSFYPAFVDPQAAKTIEVIDYDEATATARPFKLEFRKNRWVIPSHNDYPVDAGGRLAKTAAALMDLRKDEVASDAVQDHAAYGVVDPLDQKAASLTGRGKRVTLRDAHQAVLADYILGKSPEEKPGQRYVRLPGQKRTYLVKTEADPSARFADWIDAGLLRIAAGAIRRVVVQDYSVDEGQGRILGMTSLPFTLQDGQWRAEGESKADSSALNTLVSTLESLRIIDARPKPASLAQDLREGQLQMSLEAVMSLRQRGYFIAPNGRLLAKEGELIVETANGVAYTLRFGEVATSGDEAKSEAAPPENRYLFVTVSHDAARAARYGSAEGGERLARELNQRLADWYYVIREADFARLRLKRRSAR